MPEVISRFSHASTTGLTLELGPGVLCWTKTHDQDARDFLEDSYGHAVGGLCLEVFSGASGMDDQGEIVEKPATYAVWDWDARPPVRRLPEPIIDRSACRPATMGQVVKVWRALAGEIAPRATRRRSGIASSEELDVGRWIGALTLVIAGGVLAPVQVRRPTVTALSLFDVPLPSPDEPAVAVRRDAPATSVRAAALALPKSGTQRRRVLDAIGFSEPYGLTDNEIVGITGIPLNAVNPRRGELVKLGWVRADGTRQIAHHAEATVWRLTEAGRRR